jgi:hypothetical protein
MWSSIRITGESLTKDRSGAFTLAMMQDFARLQLDLRQREHQCYLDNVCHVRKQWLPGEWVENEMDPDLVMDIGL